MGTLWAYLSLLAVCIIWGTTYLAIKVGVQEIPPIFFAMIRQVIAGSIVLFLFFPRSFYKNISRDYIIHQAILGFLLILGGNGLGTLGIKYLDSGIAALFATLSPFIIVFFNSILKVEARLTWVGFVGLVLGLIGAIIVLEDDLDFYSSENGLFGLLIFFLALICWALGSVYSKTRQYKKNTFINAGYQMLFGGLLMIPLGFPFEDWSHIAFSSPSIWALLYLILIGSILGFGAYIYALSKLPATLISIHSYVNPIIALYVGWLFLGEKLNWTIAVASAFILLGVYLVGRSTRKQKGISPPIPEETATVMND